MTIETCITTDIEKAARFLQAGELVAFPTETVYGLGANAYDTDAVKKIFAAKGRPESNPLIVHIGAAQDVEKTAIHIPENARMFMDSFFPGPLTLILERAPLLSSVVSAGRATVGVRMPDNEIALAFIHTSGTVVAAPSANLSGKPSPTTWEAVREDLDGRISCILMAERTTVGLESTVVDCTVDPPVILRPGSRTLSELQGVVPSTTFSSGRNPDSHDGPRSPGTTFRHYTPEATVIVVDVVQEAVRAAAPEKKIAFIGLDSPPDISDFALTHIASGLTDYAKSVFEFFRRCDRAGVEVIYCQSVADLELGLALMDRIRRAAAR